MTSSPAERRGAAGRRSRAALARTRTMSPWSSVGALRCEVERDDAPAEHEVDAERRACRARSCPRRRPPEPLRQRRPQVRRVGLVADHADRAVGVVLADALAGGVGGHAASDDQVAVRRHALSPSSSGSGELIALRPRRRQGAGESHDRRIGVQGAPGDAGFNASDRGNCSCHTSDAGRQSNARRPLEGR